MALIHGGWRAAGLLLHPSSLHTPYGIGDLGPAAHEMIGFLKKAGLHYWQVLPMTPTGPGLGNSPYSSYSAFAGQTLLISPELLVRDGWLTAAEARAAEGGSGDRVVFREVIAAKAALIDRAFERARSCLESHQGFQDFLGLNGTWLNDYALFMAAKELFTADSWLQWPAELARREDWALCRYGNELAEPILREKFAQYLFFAQLSELTARMRAEGLGLIGDAAIYVNHDSSDVWAQPWLFCLDCDGRPDLVAGVPPDYFAKDGQLWGNPLFNWEAHRRTGFDWWKHRLWHSLGIYDWVRLDHFRAFSAYWEVPSHAETAVCGCWHPGPGADLFHAATGDKPLRIIAEDLGIITPDVTALRQQFGYPGMRVLQFAFGPEMSLSTHTPYRIEPDNAVYSATHDNNTTRGWFRCEATEMIQKQVSDLSGFEVDESNAAWALIRLAWLSPGALAVAPLQDMLNLDERARMNLPGTAEGNWGWRLPHPGMLTETLAGRLAELGALSGRDNLAHPNIMTY